MIFLGVLTIVTLVLGYVFTCFWAGAWLMDNWGFGPGLFVVLLLLFGVPVAVAAQLGSFN